MQTFPIENVKLTDEEIKFSLIRKIMDDALVVDSPGADISCFRAALDAYNNQITEIVNGKITADSLEKITHIRDRQAYCMDRIETIIRFELELHNQLEKTNA